ncbi:MAG: hypothetical protein LUH53_03100, partial [Lachnospiraceae bacterium]|nr:hypothetical protein [Lachnospiraceae bacterium]
GTYDGDAAALTETAAEAESGDSAGTETEDSTEESLPEIANSDSLTLSSIYTSSILNPDCGGEYAEEVASLEVTNASDQYLASASLTAEMSDGTAVQFVVSDLPSGATAEIFDTANQSLASGVTCESIECISEEYLEGDMLMTDTIEITSEESGAVAVLTNTGEEDLTGLTVVYHCDMAGQYFGGASYVTTIESLAAGESWELTDDTLLGEIAVVRVYQ